MPEIARAGRPWATLTGNQLGSLLADFLLAARQAAGTLTPEHYVVKTLVTTELIRRIADRYGVADGRQSARGLQVDRRRDGPPRAEASSSSGAEESYGFLVGDHVRDKDAAVASLLMAELAARLKAEGKTLYQQLDDLFLPLRLPHRRADQRADAGRKGHGRHAGADGRAPRRPPAGDSAA